MGIKKYKAHKRCHKIKTQISILKQINVKMKTNN